MFFCMLTRGYLLISLISIDCAPMMLCSCCLLASMGRHQQGTSLAWQCPSKVLEEGEGAMSRPAQWGLGKRKIMRMSWNSYE